MDDTEDERSNRKLVGRVQVEDGVRRWSGLNGYVFTLDFNGRGERTKLFDMGQCGRFVDMSMGVPDCWIFKSVGTQYNINPLTDRQRILTIHSQKML